jgi:hypothetical protein
MSKRNPPRQDSAGTFFPELQPTESERDLEAERERRKERQRRRLEVHRPKRIRPPGSWQHKG